MSTVQYDTDDAIFAFPYAEVIETLKHSIKSMDVDDDILCLDEIQSRTLSGEREITIASKEEGIINARFIYIVVELLNKGKGSVYCKQCGAVYIPLELTIQSTSPLCKDKTIKNGVFKRLIKRFTNKDVVRLPGMGWTVVTCSKGHEILRTIEWIE